MADLNERTIFDASQSECPVGIQAKEREAMGEVNPLCSQLPWIKKFQK